MFAPLGLLAHGAQSLPAAHDRADRELDRIIGAAKGKAPRSGR
jgi:hypothetical protein